VRKIGQDDHPLNFIRATKKERYMCNRCKLLFVCQKLTWHVGVMQPFFPRHIKVMGVWWVPCHYGMGGSRVADGRGGLQLGGGGKVGSHGVPTMDGPPAWLLGVGLTTTLRKKNTPVTKCHKGPWTWMDSLDRRYMLRKTDVRFGMLKVISLLANYSLERTIKI
jgi:hypothetical protein